MVERRPGDTGWTLALTLLTRRDCPLCEEFHQAFARWNARNGAHRLDIVDVDSDPLMAARFGSRVPVLLHAGTEVCALRFSEDALALRAASA